MDHRVADPRSENKSFRFQMLHIDRLSDTGALMCEFLFCLNPSLDCFTEGEVKS